MFERTKSMLTSVISTKTSEAFSWDFTVQQTDQPTFLQIHRLQVIQKYIQLHRNGLILHIIHEITT